MRVTAALITFLLFLTLQGCQSGRKRLHEAIIPTDAEIVLYHVKEHYRSLEEFTRRLYLKNPKYEQDIEARQKKLDAIFRDGEPPEIDYTALPSHEILEAAFAPDPFYEDRVFLLSLGLTRSVREAYNVEDGLLISSVQIPLERLERLYHNISHANWRLKVYRDEKGDLLFLTNAPGENGYINRVRLFCGHGK